MIRKATFTDVDVINELGTHLRSDFIKVYDIWSIINEQVDQILLLEEKEVIGFLHYVETISDFQIINIYIKKDFQNQGLGTKLISYLKIYSKPIILEVDVNNVSAINFYFANEFKIVNIRKKYYKNKSDAFTMRRELK